MGMGRLLKVLGWLVGMLVILIVAAIILVPMFVDLNDHKARIVQEVKKATGRDLVITGDIDMSVFPRFALDLNGLSLSNAPGFDAKQFAAVKRAQVRVDVIPLLFKQVLKADTIVVEGLTLNLAKSKQGATNWDDMLGKDESQETPDLPSDEHGAGGADGLMAFSIGGIVIKDARVVWDDQSTGERYEVADLNLETGEIAPGRRVDVSFNMGLESQKPRLTGKLDLTGSLLVSDQNSVVSLSDLLLDTQVTGEGLPEQGVSGQLQADLRYDQANDVLDVKGFEIVSGNLALSGTVEGRGLTANPELTGQLRLGKFSPREWLEKFGLPIPETADPKVLDALEFSSGFIANVDHVELQQMQLKLDQTTLKGELEFIAGKQSAYLFDLNVDSINLDRYLPPSQSKPASAGGRPGKGGEEELFPVEPLRQLRLDGKLLIDSLTVNQLHAKAVLLKIRGRDGKITMDQQIGRFYDGLTEGSFSLDVTAKQPKIKMTQKLSRILAGPLLQDLIGDDKLLGSGSLDLNLSGQGGTLSQLKRSLGGNVSFDFRDGAVKGFNLAQMIRQTRAKLKGEAMSISREPEQTDFSELRGQATIVNGLVNNQQLLALSPFLRVEGAGKANLIQESLDYTIRPVIVNTPEGQGGQGLEELVGIPIPVRIKGSWSDPSFSVELAQVLAEQQKAKLKEKVDSRVEEKLQEKVPEDLQDKLKGKFKKLF
jgi:AsmA protein